MKIGFIGCGNMATAIINGITNNNVVSEKDINAYDIFDGATKKLKELLCTNGGIEASCPPQ